MLIMDFIINYGGRKAEIKMPCDENELSAALAKIGANENKVEYFIAEVKLPREFKVFESKFLNLDELNYLAKRMDSFIQEEMDKFYAVVKTEKYEFPKEMINLTFNMHGYTLIQDMRDIEAVGRKHYLTTHICASVAEIEKTDFKKMGQDLINSGKGVLTEKGLLFKNDCVEQQEIYDGKVFPQYSFSGAELLCVAIEYGGKNEFIYLPENPLAIKKAINRLGAPNAESCSFRLDYFNYDNSDWQKKFEKLLCEEDIYKINNLVDLLNSEDIDLEKLQAIIEYAKRQKPELEESLSLINLLAKNLDKFGYIKTSEDSYEAGKLIITNEFHRDALPITLSNYFDFNRFVSDFTANQNGLFFEGCYVYWNTGEMDFDDLFNEKFALKIGGL